MYLKLEQHVAAASTAGTDCLIAMSRIHVATFERVSALIFNATRTFYEDGLEQAEVLLGARDPSEVIRLNAAAAEPSIEMAIAYSRSIYDVALQAQREMARALEVHIDEFNKFTVEVPPGH